MKKTGVLIRLAGRRHGPGQLQRASRLTLAALLLLAQTATPAVIVVDGADSTIADDGVCSLREAIQNANDDAATNDDCEAGSGADTIELEGDVTLTELDNGDRGLPLIESDITVDGGGFAVARDDAAPDFGIFKVVPPDGALTLHNTTVSNGATSESGGGVWNNGATLAMTNSTLSGNSAYNGGGMCTDLGGSVTMADCAATGNEAAFGGGVSIVDYSAAYVPSTAALENVSLSGNSASIAGGGIFVAYLATATLEGSTIAENYAYYNGAGVVDAFGSKVTIEDSTISGNALGYINGSGGGLIVGFAEAMVSNSTISGNYGSWGSGAYSVYEGTLLTLHNTTVVGNSGPDGYLGGGVYTTYGGVTEMANSVVADNSTADCPGGPGLVDLGGNFSSDLSCAGSAAIAPGIDIDLTLADNGGPTETHALLAGSVAIDAAGGCGLPDDQRGYGRDALCDSGAFEFEGSCKLVLEGDSTALAEVATELDVHCATPHGSVAIVGGATKGTKARHVPGCGTVQFDVRPPRKFGIADTDAEGDAFSEQTLPARFAGNTIYFQAIDFESCELTNVIEVAIE